ncbi:hypothetical protein ILUMI_02453 [Ignelater luminosus]|uniref:Retrovirus-related Pol polyprotein from transposon TNT 1-94 n=1 Tax=Ignelater luminosus TaxID=2038154 RepID=A0A8K0DI88_IGNLU|nr:hypothetical protein ILUMI_02453 [Ignelater luminosus]
MSNPINLLVLLAIKAKIVSRPSEIITIYKTNTWPKLKSVLQKNSGDNRNEITLSLDLQRLSQGRSSIKVFYESILKHLNFLMTAIENGKTKQSYDQNVALQVFLTGLNEPYGSMMRAKDPSTLVDAIRFLEKEELVRYRQRQLPSSTLNQKPTMSQKTYIMPNPTRTHGSSFSSQPINIQPKPVQQKFYTNQQVFGKPKNVFKPNTDVNENSLLDEDDNQIIQNLLENAELNKALDQTIEETRDDDNLSMQVDLNRDDDYVIRELQQN